MRLLIYLLIWLKSKQKYSMDTGEVDSAHRVDSFVVRACKIPALSFWLRDWPAVCYHNHDCWRDLLLLSVSTDVWPLVVLQRCVSSDVN